jgi:hypothetical protein
MTLEEVRSIVHAAPFQSFAMHLADGSSIRIPHPGFIAIPAAGRTVAVYKEGERSHTIVDLLLVTKLEASGSAQSTS